MQVPGLEGKKVIAVAAGREHALVATADGEVGKDMVPLRLAMPVDPIIYVILWQ
jgi:hypothetical protein